MKWRESLRGILALQFACKMGEAFFTQGGQR
jgi:hypothetical protein